MSKQAMPSWVEPQLATLTQERFSSPEWIFERKLDGERCLAFAGPDGVRLMSRSQHDITGTFPEITAALAAQRHGDLVVDGEIVAFEGTQTRFGRLQQRLGVASPGDKLLRDFPVYYYVFDVLYADGRDTRSLPLTERKKLLAGALAFRDPLRFTEHRERDGEAFYRQACADGWEGLVAKRADAPYLGTRSRDWLKFKCENAQEFVIGGYTDPQRSRVGFGALLLGYHDSGGGLVYAGKVGTGFDNRTLGALHATLAGLEQDHSPFSRGRPLSLRGVHWVEPRLVGEVGFSEWTADGELRHPRFQGMRDDKDPRAVVRELPEQASQLADLALPAVRQLVAAVRDQPVLGADRGHLGEFARHLLPHPAERDAEHPLAAREQVDDLVGRGALVHAHAVAHQRDLGEVLGPVVAQVLHGGADLLERDPGVEQPLDHLEHEDVAEAVQALGARPVRGADAGLHQSGAGPVVELPVGDPGRGAGRRTPVADLGVAIEERASSCFGPTPCNRHGHLL
jgi:DNA ligase D-like protein (predicted ligase)